MKTAEFLALMDDMLELDAGTLTGTEQLSDIPEWDSLAVISFIALLEGEKLAEAKSVHDLLALLGDHVAG